MPIPFARPYFSPQSRREIGVALDRILGSGQLMLGEYTEKFETGFARHVGAAKAVSTNTCTTALQICLAHYGVSGREVLVPAASFVTDVAAIKWAGGTPVLVDIDPETLSFDLDDLRRKLTPKTRGIIWLHLTGMISPAWREIVAFARDNGLFLIEDCAHAHGAVVDGRKAGSLGDAGCFSFYPTKVMTTGTGGIIVTDDPALEKSARELRLFGRENGVGSVVREGNDWFMDEIRACLGYHQLLELDVALARRRAIAAIYDGLLGDVPGLRLLKVPPGNLPAWYHYTVFLDMALDYCRVAGELRDMHGVPTKPIYLPTHKEAIFRDLDDGKLGRTEDVLGHSLCLPLFVGMQDDAVHEVARAVTAAVR